MKRSDVKPAALSFVFPSLELLFVVLPLFGVLFVVLPPFVVLFPPLVLLFDDPDSL